MTKKFKKYYTGQTGPARGSGKGDDRRESQVSAQEMSANWCRTYGHRFQGAGACCNACGAPAPPPTFEDSVEIRNVRRGNGRSSR